MIPTACLIYLSMVTGIVRREWPELDPAYIMAQMNQESSCNRFAQSPFAAGLMQFTPSTAADMGKGLCKDLGEVKRFDPEWSITCGVRYLKFLFSKMPEYMPFWERIAAAYSAYNGGRGWVNRDNRVCSKVRWCDSSKWFNHVEFTPDERRARHNIKENRGYMRRIMYKLLQRYL